MNHIKVYVDMIYGKRMPNLAYSVNGAQCECYLLWSEQKTNFVQHTIWDLECELQDHNHLEISMSDKTDDDLLIRDGDMVDHYVEIKNIEIDGIMIDHLVHKIGVFRHSMPDSWVNMMRDRGINIEPCYRDTTQIRLNGIWRMEFDLPIWQWCARISV